VDDLFASAPFEPFQEGSILGEPKVESEKIFFVEEFAQLEERDRRRKAMDPSCQEVCLVCHFAADRARPHLPMHYLLRAWPAGRASSEQVLAPGRIRDVREEEAMSLAVGKDRAGSKGWRTLSFDLGCKDTRISFEFLALQR
jgi:hypothetical protein